MDFGRRLPRVASDLHRLAMTETTTPPAALATDLARLIEQRLAEHVREVAAELGLALAGAVDGAARDLAIAARRSQPLDRLDVDDLPPRMTTGEVCAVLGVGRRSLGRYLASGRLRATRPAGGRLVIDRADLAAFLDGNRS